MKKLFYTIIGLAIVFAAHSLQAQTVSTYAGNGTTGFSGDGGSALGASFGNLAYTRMAVDTHGSLYIADKDNGRIRKIATNGTITTFAGGGLLNYTYDGVAATEADLGSPSCVATDAQGNVYISTQAIIRKVDTAGIITTVLGNGAMYPISFFEPYVGEISDMKSDKHGNLYFADQAFAVIGRLDTAGGISLIAGTYGMPTGNMNGGDGVPATSAQFNALNSICFDNGGNIYITDYGQLRMIDTAGIIHNVAGGDGISNADTLDGAINGGAFVPGINYFTDVAVDKNGYIYTLTDGGLYKMYGPEAMSNIGGHTITCNDSYYPSDCENCLMDTASLGDQSHLVCDSLGNMYFADAAHDRIRKITQGGGNKISGIIPAFCILGSSTSPILKVSLYQYDTISSALQCLDSTTTSQYHGTFYYEFLDKPVGNYVLKAELISDQPSGTYVLPSYSYSSPYWDSVYYWKHNLCIDNQTFVNMMYVNATTGTDTVSGTITSGEAKNTDEGIPVSDMGVFLRDASNTIVAYTHTNAAGDYVFPNLPNGDYNVFPGAINYTTTPNSLFTLSAAQPAYANANFRQHTGARTITPYLPTAIAEIATGKSISAYPNPATDELHITGILSGDEIKLFDMTGRVVSTEVANTGGAYNTNVKTLAAGSYTLQVKDAKGVAKYNKGIIKK